MHKYTTNWLFSVIIKHERSTTQIRRKYGANRRQVKVNNYSSMENFSESIFIIFIWSICSQMFLNGNLPMLLTKFIIVFALILISKVLIFVLNKLLK